MMFARNIFINVQIDLTGDTGRGMSRFGAWTNKIGDGLWADSVHEQLQTCYFILLISLLLFVIDI